MPVVKQSDFSVDLAEREVRHVSGVVVEFDEYSTPDAWCASDSVHIRNPDLFGGNIKEIAAGAKHAALAAGMTHRKP